MLSSARRFGVSVPVDSCGCEILTKLLAGIFPSYLFQALRYGNGSKPSILVLI